MPWALNYSMDPYGHTVEDNTASSPRSCRQPIAEHWGWKPVLASFLLLWENILTKSNLGRKRFLLAPNPGLLQASQSNRNLKQLLKFIEEQEKKWIMHACVCSVTFLYLNCLQTREWRQPQCARLPHWKQSRHFPTDMPIDYPPVDNPSPRLSLQVNLRCVKLTVKTITGPMCPSLIRDWLLTGPVWCRPSANKCSCCEFMLLQGFLASLLNAIMSLPRGDKQIKFLKPTCQGISCS